MIIENQLKDAETEIAGGSHVYLKDGDQEAFVAWPRLTPGTQRELLRIITEADKLRARALGVLKAEGFIGGCFYVDASMDDVCP